MRAVGQLQKARRRRLVDHHPARFANSLECRFQPQRARQLEPQRSAASHGNRHARGPAHLASNGLPCQVDRAPSAPRSGARALRPCRQVRRARSTAPLDRHRRGANRGRSSSSGLNKLDARKPGKTFSSKAVTTSRSASGSSPRVRAVGRLNTIVWPQPGRSRTSAPPALTSAAPGTTPCFAANELISRKARRLARSAAGARRTASLCESNVELQRWNSVESFERPGSYPQDGGGCELPRHEANSSGFCAPGRTRMAGLASRNRLARPAAPFLKGGA